jgi:hypothetical protein
MSSAQTNRGRPRPETTIADQFGIDPADLQPSMRLLHDLGLDGDEARRFFATFLERHPFDDSELMRNWSRHFGDEGFRPRRMLFVFSAVELAAAASVMFDAVPPWLLYLGAVLLLTPAAVVMTARREEKRFSPVTVADLIAAAETRRWPLTYPDAPDAGAPPSRRRKRMRLKLVATAPETAG